MRRVIGNILIIVSIATVAFIYYPFLSAYFSPPISDEKLNKTNFYIKIPKINAAAPIIENVDPWNKSDYEGKLKLGVAKAKGFENFYFAHSSLDPWEMTRTNTAFLRLGELKNGDTILIVKNGQEQKYEVIDKKEIWPNQVEFVANKDSGVLILQTCTPLGTDLKRLLVFAKQV